MNTFRRFLRVLGLSLFSILGVTISEAQTPPIRIMPLGDSLTVGGSPITLVEGSYRNRLFSLLTNAGYNVDFVGTKTDTNNPPLPDRNHQGMGGYQIAQIQADLSSWLNVIEDPDVVLLLIGTNDFSANFNVASAQTRLADLVTDIATKRPFAKIIVSNLPRRTDDPAIEALQSSFNASIPGMVNNQVALGRQVTFVDVHTALITGDFDDGVHPTLAGYDKMADVWFPAITSVIAPLGSSNPPAIARTEPPVDLQHITVRFSKPLADSATSLANFSLTGGLLVTQAVLDPVAKRTITLTTSQQVPGTLYTLSVSGVRDRTPQQNQIAAGATVNYSSYTLVNGSFEAGVTGWTMTGNFLLYDNTPPYIASNGGKMVIFNGGETVPNGVVSQTFPTVPGQFYMVDFDLGILALNFAEQRLGLEIIGSSPLVSATESVFGNGQSNSVWTPKSRSFFANSATTTLTFRDLSASTSSLDLMLDNVRVTAALPPLNTAPVAVADAYSTTRDTPLVVPAAGVLTNDTDAQATPLSAVVNLGPVHGSLTLNANGGFTYTPSNGFTGGDSFTYHAFDGSLSSNIVTVNITVNAIASGSLVNGSFEAGEAGWTMTGNYLVYPGDSSYVADDGVNMVVLNGGDTIPNGVVSQTFATVPGQQYELDFKIGCLALNFNEVRLKVEVTGGAPLVALTESVFGNGQGNSVWAARSYPFTADSATTILTFRDHSPSGSGLDLLLDNVKITPATGPVNTAPVAVTESYSTNINTALVVPVLGVLTNDTDAESNPLTAIINASPSHGGVVLNSNGSFTYTPTLGFTGADSFTYRANDGSLDSNIATVNISVNTIPVGNLVNGSFENVFVGWTTSGNVSIDSSGFYPPTDGSKVASFNRFNMNPNGVLSQSFATVAGQTYSLAFDVGVLAYTVDPQLLQVKVTGTGNLLSQTITINGLGGGATRWVPKSLSFVANSTSTTLTFRDQSTATIGIDLLLDNVRVSLASGPVNTAPLAAGESYSTNNATALVIPAAGVLANDVDAQSNALTAVLDVGPSHGNLILNPNGGFTYTPSFSYTGIDSFTYHANDGSLNSNIVAVNITVNALVAANLVNGSFEANFTGWTTSGSMSIKTAPYPVTDGLKLAAFNSNDSAPNGVISQTIATVPGQTYALAFDAGVLAYTEDPQVLQVTAVGTGSLLSQMITITGLGGGATRWLPQSFTFVADNTATTLTFRDQSPVTIGLDLLLDNVRVTSGSNPGNTAPVAVADSYSTHVNTTLVVPATGVLANDTDAQSNPLTAVVNAGPANGNLSLNANGGFTYTPTGGYTGVDSFTYHAHDGNLDSNLVTVNIAVNGVVAAALVNGSFEADFTGWTTSGNLSIKIAPYYPVTDGAKLASFNNNDLTPNAVISQSFATVPGQTYTLAFDAGVLAYTEDSQTLQVKVAGTASLLSQMITIAGLGGGNTHWAPQSFTFVADSTASTLTFLDRSTLTVGLDLLLDHVRVTATASSAFNPLGAGTTGALSAAPTLVATAEACIVSMTASQAGNYILERSTDLSTWNYVSHQQCAAQDLIEFHDNLDPLDSGVPVKQMFYRIGFDPSVVEE